jgi:hypothetical protein
VYELASSGCVVRHGRRRTLANETRTETRKRDSTADTDLLLSGGSAGPSECSTACVSRLDGYLGSQTVHVHPQVSKAVVGTALAEISFLLGDVHSLDASLVCLQLDT